MSQRIYISVVVCFCFAGMAVGQEPVDFRKIIQDLSEKCEKASDCLFEGEMEVAGQQGSQASRLLVKAKVRFASSESGKYFLRVERPDGEGYTLVSDGQKSWAYVPKLKQYTEQESAAVVDNSEDDDEDDSGSASAAASDEEKDLAETFARQVIPTLAGLRKNAAMADTRGVQEVKFEGKKQKWPVVRVISREDEAGRNRVDLAVDPATLNIGRMLWLNVRSSANAKTAIQMTMEFSTFRVGENLPADTFVFEPPKKAKLVDAVPIPGQTGSFLLNRTAPDFELKSIGGEQVRLSELRGHPVLLSFWATWCGPCRKELPELAKIYAAYNDKGLRIFGVNQEGKGTVRDYTKKANLPFDTLDDSGRKVGRLYRVHSIPSVFLIDANGKVVRYFKGTHQEAAFREALKSVGL